MSSTSIHPDWDLIVRLGGPVKVARLLGFSSAGSVQRVQNWKSRGVPARVKVAHPTIFLLPAAANESGGGQQQAAA